MRIFYFAWFSFYTLLVCDAAKAVPCDIVDMTGEIIAAAFSAKSPQAQSRAYAVANRSLQKQVHEEIDRQRIALSLFNGEAVPRQHWSVYADAARYLCTPGVNAQKALVPQACSFDNSPKNQAALQTIREIIRENIAHLQNVQKQLKECGGQRTSGSLNQGFGLVEPNGESAPGLSLNDPVLSQGLSVADTAEMANQIGQIFWPPEVLEQNPQITSTTRAALSILWSNQVVSLFEDFTASNIENGTGLHHDVKLQQEGKEGELNVLYRNGQRVMAFLKPEGIYLKVFVEVPNHLRSSLSDSSAVSLLLKRTSGESFSGHGYELASSLNEAYEAAAFQQSLVQLDALDKKANELLLRVNTITKGLEAGLKKQFANTRMRYKTAASILWLPTRAVGGAAGLLSGTYVVAPLLNGIDPVILNHVPTFFFLTGLMSFGKGLYASLANFHEKIATFMDGSRAENVRKLAEFENTQVLLQEFRAQVGLLRMELDTPGCRSLVQDRVKRLIEQGQRNLGL
jgi:hypothetical protein